nr:cupin domain-containing protein [Canibacter zhuwentaonis]
MPDNAADAVPAGAAGAGCVDVVGIVSVDGSGVAGAGDPAGIAARIAAKLGLKPLPHEGGLFRNTLASVDSTAIYFMVTEAGFSALHRLESSEVYHWYAGSPLQITVLHPDGSGENIILGQDVLGGEVPQVVVPGGCFHGSRPLGAWTLLGTTMAPPFSWEQFTLAERAHLLRSHPRFAADIARLTRD